MSFHIQNIYRHFGYGITYMSTATPYPVYIFLFHIQNIYIYIDWAIPYPVYMYVIPYPKYL